MAREEKGRWTNVFSPEFDCVLVHASLLPDGTILYWGRRQHPKAKNSKDLDEHFTTAFVWTPPSWVAPPWNPSTQKFGESKSTPISGKSTPAKVGRAWDLSTNTLKPVPNPPNGPLNRLGNGTVNLFCGGHCFLPDGNLLVVGGHIKDNEGLRQTSVYNYKTKEFWSMTEMNNGRWYPSALPLPDGRVLVLSGSYKDGDKDPINNSVPQIWSPNDPNAWKEVAAPIPDQFVFPLYPRVHLDPNGRRVLMAGPLEQSWFLELKDKNNKEIVTQVKTDNNKSVSIYGRWKSAEIKRKAGARDYCPSVMYDSGKILYIGGGDGNGGPTTQAEYIDLKAEPPEWKMTNMNTQRRQFNATVLPDGTVFVTGGTRASGFNNLDTNNPVHEAELWNPVNQKWTTMASENSNRCYHAIALLLPDGRVLSAGGGEYGDADKLDNQNLTDGQFFEPPYLFKGPRPTIQSAPKEINCGANLTFPVTVGTDDSIDRVSLVRLGSVTHCRNMNQSLMFLGPIKQTGTKITVPAPADENHAPPGHYMLFVLNQLGVPSEAPIVRVVPAPTSANAFTASMRVADISQPTIAAKQVQPTLLAHNERIINEQARPPVVVGLTPVCPYGLGGCWGVAHDALQRLSGIETVRPVPDHTDSLAFVYLQQEDILPDIDEWRDELEKATNKGYHMRGIEVTVTGVCSKTQHGANEQLTLAATSTRPTLILAPFQASSQLKFDMAAQSPRPIDDAEAGAYKRLSATLADHPVGLAVQVTGTLQKQGANEYSLNVREFEVNA
ncbi:uncharacterized protein KY384_001179 [Bacidia gigantensis]|uniref:uncharacterized protein n=1 Tax=Bacidia gigantensis TaxID=2732470 RepID=UPI001D054806|nr:uncharacterized protein KY384_001179 [Bacidia gigantensis]KAG8534335.1 hypothetical protein KY384_001179 [Bacidia gigantensis]